MRGYLKGEYRVVVLLNVATKGQVDVIRETETTNRKSFDWKLELFANVSIPPCMFTIRSRIYVMHCFLRIRSCQLCRGSVSLYSFHCIISLLFTGIDSLNTRFCKV